MDVHSWWTKLNTSNDNVNQVINKQLENLWIYKGRTTGTVNTAEHFTYSSIRLFWHDSSFHHIDKSITILNACLTFVTVTKILCPLQFVTDVVALWITQTLYIKQSLNHKQLLEIVLLAYAFTKANAEYNLMRQAKVKIKDARCTCLIVCINSSRSPVVAQLIYTHASLFTTETTGWLKKVSCWHSKQLTFLSHPVYYIRHDACRLPMRLRQYTRRGHVSQN